MNTINSKASDSAYRPERTDSSGTFSEPLNGKKSFKGLHPFSLPLNLSLRRGVQEDLEKMEWFGMFNDHREILLSAFQAQEQDKGLIIVADLNRFPVGQIFIDLVKKAPEKTGYFWAFRVFPFLQNLGIGSRLLAVAEQILDSLGFVQVECGVEKTNLDALRLYRRLGYRIVGILSGEYSYTTPEGVFQRVPLDQFILRKRLRLN